MLRPAYLTYKEINAVTDLKVDPSVVDEVVEVILVDEVLRDVGDLDFRVLWIVEWICEVVVADIICDELGTFARENTVKREFTKIEGRGFGTGVAVVYNDFSHDGDACAIGVGLLGAELAHDFCDGDAAAAVGGMSW